MNYYIKKDDEICLFDSNLNKLKNTLRFMPEFKNSEIFETYKNIFTFNEKNYFEDDEKYKQLIEYKRKEDIKKLSLTKREVLLALYKSNGSTPENVKQKIADPEALIEFEYANEYFRGNPLIDEIGKKLGYTSDDLDYLFLNKKLPLTFKEDKNALV